jgi:glucose dehydrogenase
VSGRRVVVVGAGMMGATLCFELARAGFDVTVFEKGPDFPWPPRRRFVELFEYDYEDPACSLPGDLSGLEQTGSYRHDLRLDRALRVGGSGTMWSALSARPNPVDLRTRSLRGFGDDWPIGYDELEPWLCRAEEHLGISGTDDDNPWAPPRSRPYPLPPFPLTEDDAWVADRLAADGVRVHTTAQARTRLDYQGRPACMNIGQCPECPIGARYVPTFHLQQALATGRCRLVTRTTVRRVLTDGRGRASGVVTRTLGERHDREHGADLVIVANAAFEAARLLLLSRDAHHPDGLGNQSGHVGRHLAFHHIWIGHVHPRRRLNAGKVGFWTAQSHQFCDPPGRGRHGAVKIELPSTPWPGHERAAGEATSLEEAMAAFEPTTRCRVVGLCSESDTTEAKRVTLSRRTDRWGDPLAHVHYDSSEFDRGTYAFGRGLFERVARALDATESELPGLEGFGTYGHHMGACRMSARPADGVVDPFGEVHDTPGLYAVGLGMFVGGAGALNPTLTGVALTLRAADAIVRRGA